MKFDFEIAVDEKTRARDRTFEGVPDSGCPRDSHAHILTIFGPVLPNRLYNLHAQSQAFWSSTFSYLSPEHTYISFIKIG